MTTYKKIKISGIHTQIQHYRQLNVKVKRRVILTDSPL